jgi:diacylglycerol kinase
MVIVSETINSAIEALCDTVSLDYKVNIKYAKDVSAGAVLVSAIVSVITGIIIFLPYFIAGVKKILELVV